MKLLFLFITCSLFISCGPKSGGNSTATESVTAPKVSIDIQSLEDITTFNAASFTISGSCTEEGQPIIVLVEELSPETAPTCSNGTWSTEINVTRLSETSEPISITVDHASSGELNAPQATESVSLYPDISINLRALEDITASNAASFNVKGHCSEEGELVDVSIGELSLETSPVCTHGAWTVTVDATSLNKVSEDISITVDHSPDGGPAYPQLTQNVTNHFVCPENYVGVPSLTNYTTHSFCVMKYEAKNQSGVAVSQASGTPYTGINRADAIFRCTGLNSAGEDKHDLITNDEWQTLARNIELVPSNWATGVVGNIGGLSSGHSDNVPNNALAASGDDTEGCEGTGETCDNDTWDSQRRTHTLSNGEIIWDVSGNASEWVKDINIEVQYGESAWMSQVTTETHTILGALSEGTTTTPRVAKDQFGPSGDYSNLNSGSRGNLGYGDFYERAGGGIFRGDSFLSSTGSGIFSVLLFLSHSATLSSGGFRCVYRP